MLSQLVRVVGGIAAGVLVALAGVIGVELFSAVVHPFPKNFDYNSMEQIQAHVANYPSWVLAIVVPVYGAIAWFSAWVTNRIGGRMPTLVIGTLLLVALVFNILMLPYPIWFEVTSVTAILVALYLVLRGWRSN